MKDNPLLDHYHHMLNHDERKPDDETPEQQAQREKVEKLKAMGLREQLINAGFPDPEKPNKEEKK